MDNLFSWINQFYTISSLNDLNNTSTLVLFIEKLFKIKINEEKDILNQITYDTSLNLPANFNFQDQEQLLVILEFIRAQYTLHHHILNNHQLSFTCYIHQTNPHNDLCTNLIAWLNYILSDYISASLILPIHNLLLSTHWTNGHYLLCILHYHIPSILSNLNKYLLQQDALSIFIKLFSETFQTHPSFTSNNNILQLLLDFIPFLKTPSDADTILRHQHMSRFTASPLSATPSLSSTIEDEEDPETYSTSTTLTSTYTMQQLRITKTTKYSDDCSLTDKINHLLHQLELIIPTRSSNYSPTHSDHQTVDSAHTVWDDLPTQFNEDHPSHQQPWVRILHPLQAAEEDYAVYDRNFRQLVLDFQTLSTHDMPLFWKHNKRDDQVQQLYETLKTEFEHAEACLAKFKRGFGFARVCASIRQDLDSVQHQMVKSITTQQEIEDLEACMLKTKDMVDSLQVDFKELLMEPAYMHQLEFIQNKNALVQSWVDEVRVWFAEAGRIRQWIEIRIDQLNTINVPDPLTSSVQADQVAQLTHAHHVLEKEIEAFDKEDMARLRSHVKTLTGSDRANKDLSPADTTTIEITLTTLMTLDKLMHSLRKKNYDLQILSQRVAWEEEYHKSMEWLKEMDGQVDVFLTSHARWTPAEEDEQEGVEHMMKRKRRMEREKQKESVVQQLLALERKMTEFDAGQFTVTVDLFQDLDSASSVDLPAALESKQIEMEQFFEDLMKRMTFARKVVEQRLNLMDFLHQSDLVIEDALLLQMDLVDAEMNVRPGDNDRELTARVQNMHELMVQLVTATASRIPYPSPELDLDKDNNQKANDAIIHIVTTKRNDLVLLCEDLDERLHTFRNVLQLHRRAKDYLNDADKLTDWADERVKIIRRAKTNVQDDVNGYTAEDLPRLQRDYDHILNKLKNGKENEVVDLLTRIQLLVETTQKLKISSIDRESLRDASDHLQERFDRLQQILEEYGLLLDGLRQKLKDGKTYSEQARCLREFIHDTRHALPSLKQKCGFMTGQSQEQDQKKLDTLTQSLSNMKEKNMEQQIRYKQLCKQFHLMEPSKTENMEEIRATQQQLDADWSQLQDEMQDLTAFSDIVGQWYTRQRRLSMIEREIDISPDAEDAEKHIQSALKQLEEIGIDITNSLNSEDPLQIANYSCARDRQLALTSKAQAVMDALIALRSNATQATAVTDFLQNVENLKNQIQEQREEMDRRMGGLEGFASTSMSSIDNTFKHLQTANGISEKSYHALAQTLDQLVNEKLESGIKTTAINDAITDAKDKLSQLFETIQQEKKQAVFVRKVYIHSKAAHDLQVWIDQCSSAVSQLWSEDDTNIIKQELDQIELKMVEMKPTIQAFEAMESRIFTTFHSTEKQAVQERQASILKHWQDLQNQHRSMRQWVDHSKQGQEVLGKIKTVLVQIKDMKDRVNAVRICRNTQLDDGLENRDLNMVLSCPLASIPTEHRLASAKAELDILDREMESHLLPSVQALNRILKDDTYDGYGQDVSSAVNELQGSIKLKRRAIAEAEKMEGFLTVMEELEVLLLALNEVISRGSPEHARKVDGHYIQSDLQALFIDLDTRYRYYEPKIDALFDEAQEVSEKLKDDRRVVDCLEHLYGKWKQLQQQAGAKKMNLLKLIGPQATQFDPLEEAGEGILKEKAKKVKQPVVGFISPPSPKPVPSTPRFNKNRSAATTPIPFALSATAARAQVKRSSMGGTISPVERRVNARQAAAQQQRLKVNTKLPYVADPKNDLDVALGNIVNDSPYKVQVKMVPGEVGKYWFGHVNPKLAYCRILRSRMVMVRVGGGWVELSQFLRDHALLENNVLPGKPSRASLPPTPRGIVHDGFLSVGTSNSTPSRQNVPLSHGIKSGNKFLVAVDDKGNQVQVKMTKAKSKTTKFITPRRNL